jgi:hypothetical protein
MKLFFSFTCYLSCLGVSVGAVKLPPQDIILTDNEKKLKIQQNTEQPVLKVSLRH